MPRLKRFRCEFGVAPHDEAFACHECGHEVCGYHAERSVIDEDWLCPECFNRERCRVERNRRELMGQEHESFISTGHRDAYLSRVCPTDGMSCGACPTTGCDHGALRAAALGETQKHKENN